MNTRMCAAFIGIAVTAGVVSSFAIDAFRTRMMPPPISSDGKPITIAREDVERTLSADDAAKRETESLRHHTGEQKTASRLVKDALVLGDISYGALESDVRARYGAPSKIESERSLRYAGSTLVEYEYADSLSIDLVDGSVRLVKISDRSNLSSGKGVRIGTSAAELRQIYGEPSLIYGEDYIYFSEEDPTIGFAFEIEHGYVDEIKMGDLGL